MTTYSPAQIRNIAFLGHANSGKTSLVEALLLATGSLHELGLVEKGNTASDFREEEIHHGHSLFNSVLHCDYQDTHINLIDTPGSPDFMGQAVAILPAVETVALVINAQMGIESVTRRMIQQAKDRNLCRMIIINKIDADNVNLPELVEQIQEAFGPECLPINLPASNGSAVVDVFDHAQGEADFSSVAEAHTRIVDQVVEVDEKLMERYLEEGEVSADELHAPFEKALREGHLIPICFTSARSHSDPSKSVGIKELVDILVKLAPSPLEGNPREFLNHDEPVFADPDPAKSVIAHVFKVVNDRFGRQSIFRVHQGTVRKDMPLYVGDAKKPIRVAHLYKIQGAQTREITHAVPGDIAALVKIDEIGLDAVLHDSHEADHLRLRPLDFPKPMFGLAVTARSRSDETKIGDALAKLDDEDPTFEVTRDQSTGETIISGMGDMHLRVVLEQLKSKFNVEVETKPPKIAYRESVTVQAEGHHRHKKQTGGAGQFGEVYLRIAPKARGEGFEFVDDTFGGSVPQQFIPAIEKGVRQVLEEGCIAGYPIQDVTVSVYDGKHHPVDSKEVAFVTAARKAFKDAVSKGKPVLLEPIVDVEVTVPNQFMGDITSDLAGKRGRIQGTDIQPGDMAVVKAQVPLAEMNNYQSQLKSVTAGQGSYTMEYSHYDPMPPNLQADVVARYKPHAEEE